MEKLITDFFSRKIIVETRKPYEFAMEIMRVALAHGQLRERENRYETSGPVKSLHVAFSLRRVVSRHAMMKLSFDIRGELSHRGYVEVLVSARFLARHASARGPVTQAYGDYFLKHVYPALRSRAEADARNLGERIVAEIDASARAYSQA